MPSCRLCVLRINKMCEMIAKLELLIGKASEEMHRSHALYRVMIEKHGGVWEVPEVMISHKRLWNAQEHVFALQDLNEDVHEKMRKLMGGEHHKIPTEAPTPRKSGGWVKVVARKEK